jgi:PAS domain S-box-containing protein
VIAHRQITAEAQQERDLASAILDAIGALVVVLDPQGRITRFNRACEETAGYAFEEVRGQYIWDLLPPEEVEPAKAGFENLQASQFPNQNENHWVARDGQRRLIAWSNTAIVDARGAVAYVIGTGADVTARRQAEQALRENEERYRTLAEAAQDSIFIIGRDGRIEYLNPYAAARFGRQPEELIGKRVEEVFPPHSFARQKHNLQRVLESGESRFFEDSTTFPDCEAWQDTWLSPLKGPDGAVWAVMGVARDMTAHRQVVEALQESEARYRAVVEDQTELICRFQLDGTLTFVNEAYCRYVGQRREELIGHSFFPFIPLEDQAEVRRNIASLSLERPVVTYEDRALLPSGEIRWQQWTNRAIFDEEGHLVEFQTVGRDITEHKQAEEAARRHAETLAALHETALDLANQRALPDLLQAIVVRATELLKGKSGTIYLYRPASDDLEYVSTYKCGYELIGTVLQRGEGLAGKVLETGRPLAVDNYRRWEGRSRQFDDYGFAACVAVPIRWGDCLLGVLDVDDDAPRTFSAADIGLLERFTPLAAAALENARLLDIERRRRQIAETLRQASTVLGSTLELDKVLELILQQLRQVIPYDSASIQRLQGESVEIVACQGFADPQKVLQLAFPLDPQFPNYEVVLARALVSIPDVASAYPHFRSEASTYESGHIRSWLGVPLVAKDQVIGLIALDRAVVQPFTPEESALALTFAYQAAMAIENARLYSDLQQQMERLRSTQAQLVQSAKLAAVGELAAGVAHELNNPLTGVLGFGELLLETTPGDDPDRRDLETIVAEARRARDIVRSLLDFARQVKPHKRPADLAQVLHQTLGLIRQHVEESGVEAVEEYARDLDLVPADEGQIKQVFLNLISNAAQAMPAGGTLHLRVARQGEEVAVAIKDTGTGMPAEVREHLFEPFFTTKPGGTGLGLSVSLGIVQQHGGRITVESEVGQGSTFTVWLPAGGAGEVEEAPSGTRPHRP